MLTSTGAFRLCAAGAILFAVGCTPTMAVGDTAVTQSAQRWSHKCIPVADAGQGTEAGKKLGESGWELVGVASHASALVLCFRRPR